MADEILVTTALGVLRWRLDKTRRKMTVTSTKPISLPAGPAPCPAPEPPEPPVLTEPASGWGIYGIWPSPNPPFPLSANGAGIAHVPFTDDLTWTPGAVQEGPDYSLQLVPAPINWSGPQSLSAEIFVEYQDTFADQTMPAQSYWLGLEDAGADNGIYVGYMGSRDQAPDGPAWGCWIMVDGVIKMGPTALVEIMDTPAPGVPIKLVWRLYPVGGGTAGRRAVSLSVGIGDDWQEVNTAFNSMDPLLLADWQHLVEQLEAGTMRPVLKVTRRDGGPEASGTINFTRFRWH